MTLEQCPSCKTWMREYQHNHRCPNCNYTVPKLVYSSWHGRNTRASLYPNHTSTSVTVTNGFLKVAAWTAVMIILMAALAALSDPVLQSMRGGI